MRTLKKLTIPNIRGVIEREVVGFGLNLFRVGVTESQTDECNDNPCEVGVYACEGGTGETNFLDTFTRTTSSGIGSSDYVLDSEIPFGEVTATPFHYVSGTNLVVFNEAVDWEWVGAPNTPYGTWSYDFWAPEEAEDYEGGDVFYGIDSPFDDGISFWMYIYNGPDFEDGHWLWSLDTPVTPGPIDFYPEPLNWYTAKFEMTPTTWRTKVWKRDDPEVDWMASGSVTPMGDVPARLSIGNKSAEPYHQVLKIDNLTATVGGECLLRYQSGETTEVDTAISEMVMAQCTASGSSVYLLPTLASEVSAVYIDMLPTDVWVFEPEDNSITFPTPLIAESLVHARYIYFE